MNYDKAVEAAAEALNEAALLGKGKYSRMARIAVEAAAPHLRYDLALDKDEWRDRAERAEAERDLALGVKATANKRAERAEAEVERLERHIGNVDKRGAEKWRALADELSEALHCPCISWPYRCEKHEKTLDKYKEARRDV